MIPFIYDHAFYFTDNGLAKISKDKLYDFIDKSGKLVFVIVHDFADFFMRNDFIEVMIRRLIFSYQ